MSGTRKDGGAAFPIAPVVIGDRCWDEDASSGMSLRDWFAGQALGAVILATSAGQHSVFAPKPGKPDDLTVVGAIAFDAYELADAMLAERERQP